MGGWHPAGHPTGHPELPGCPRCHRTLCCRAQPHGSPCHGGWGCRARPTPQGGESWWERSAEPQGGGVPGETAIRDMWDFMSCLSWEAKRPSLVGGSLLSSLIGGV